MLDNDNKIQIGAFSHPRRSSDLFAHAEKKADGRECAISVVFDTIGRPQRSRIRKVFKEIDKVVKSVVEGCPCNDIEDLDQRFKQAMIEMNRFTRETGERQRGFFGFCFAAALRVDRSVRIHWLGDCRSYHFKKDDSDGAGITAECLTQDNNRLTTDILAMDRDKPGIEVEMLKNEMLELSRRLHFYMGIRDDKDFADQFDRQSRTIKLSQGEMLMITTDGMLMPVIRHEVTNSGFRLSKNRLYLEEWFENYIENGDYLRDLEGMAVWDSMISDLKSACLEYTRNRRRYRDDMAVVYMCCCTR